MNDTAGTSGFTLVEVAVAVAILGLAFVTLIGLHTRMLDVYTTEHNRLRASLCARYLMTGIETAASAPDLDTKQGLLKEALEDAGYFDDDALDDSREAVEGWTYTLSVTSQDLPLVADALRRVDININWGNTADDSFSLVYFRDTEVNLQALSAAAGLRGGSRSGTGGQTP